MVEWISLCASVDHSLVHSRRLLVEDGARKIKLLLSSPHAAHPDHFLQVFFTFTSLSEARLKIPPIASLQILPASLPEAK